MNRLSQDDLNKVLVAVAKICNKNPKRSYDKPYAMPRTVARELKWYDQRGQANGNRAKKYLNELVRQEKLICLGKAKLRSREVNGGQALKYADAFVLPTIK